MARDINRLGDGPEAIELARQLRAGADVVGLLSEDPVAWFEAGSTTDADNVRIDSLLEQRTNARTAKDFAEADRIRDELTDMGVVIEDGPNGPRWRRAGT
jgi:cysteinyl-tRNA synthetase